MAFKASRVRQRRAPEPIGRGKPIIPSAAVEIWYRKQMLSLAKAMLADYKEQIRKVLASNVAKNFYAHDASINSLFQATLNSLQQRWSKLFEAFADKIAPEFVDRTDGAATTAALHSLSTAGLKQPVATYTEGVRQTLQASKTYNHTLITNISQEVHEKVFSAVMLSLTSPNPEEQGIAGISNALRKATDFSEDRIKLIAKDQTSKIYSALSDERMIQNGVEEFEWMHSSAGKVPRQSHLEKNGEIFKINDPRLWEGPKADQGPPGWAINCRCRKVPIIR
jgi:SPP1 gp7 family putative phage head morphogenesis protein